MRTSGPGTRPWPWSPTPTQEHRQRTIFGSAAARTSRITIRTWAGITVPFTEAEILEKVRDLAIKTVNLLLNLCDFFKMAQKEGEGVCQYMARLSRAANLVDFTVGSSTETVSYVNQMVLEQILAGLRDKQITREILQEAAIKGFKTS